MIPSVFVVVVVFGFVFVFVCFFMANSIVRITRFLDTTVPFSMENHTLFKKKKIASGRLLGSGVEGIPNCGELSYHAV